MTKTPTNRAKQKQLKETHPANNKPPQHTQKPATNQTRIHNKTKLSLTYRRAVEFSKNGHTPHKTHQGPAPGQLEQHYKDVNSKSSRAHEPLPNRRRTVRKLVDADEHAHRSSWDLRRFGPLRRRSACALRSFKAWSTLLITAALVKPGWVTVWLIHTRLCPALIGSQ